MEFERLLEKKQREKEENGKIRISMFFEKKMIEELDLLAKKFNTNRSFLIRKIIEHFLASNKID